MSSCSECGGQCLDPHGIEVDPTFCAVCKGEEVFGFCLCFCPECETMLQNGACGDCHKAIH